MAWSTQNPRKESWKTSFGSQQKQIESLNKIMGAVTVIVVLMTAALVVMVLGLFIEAFRDKTNAYQALQEKTESLARSQKSVAANQDNAIEVLGQKISDLSWLVSQQTKVLQSK